MNLKKTDLTEPRTAGKAGLSHQSKSNPIDGSKPSQIPSVADKWAGEGFGVGNGCCFNINFQLPFKNTAPIFYVRPSVINQTNQSHIHSFIHSFTPKWQ